MLNKKIREMKTLLFGTKEGEKNNLTKQAYCKSNKQQYRVKGKKYGLVPEEIETESLANNVFRIK